MNTVQSDLERARTQAQQLHQQIEAAAAKNQAGMRADMAQVADKARQLGDSLKTASNGQRADAQDHVQKARAALEDASARAKAAATAAAADAKSASEAARERVRQAVAQLTDAVAIQRSKARA